MTDKIPIDRLDVTSQDIDDRPVSEVFKNASKIFNEGVTVREAVTIMRQSASMKDGFKILKIAKDMIRQDVQKEDWQEFMRNSSAAFIVDPRSYNKGNEYNDIDANVIGCARLVSAESCTYKLSIGEWAGAIPIEISPENGFVLKDIYDQKGKTVVSIHNKEKRAKIEVNDIEISGMGWINIAPDKDLGGFGHLFVAPGTTISGLGIINLNKKIYIDGQKGDILLAGADCAEEFDILEDERIDAGTVLVIGNDGKLHPSHKPYDKRVAGIVSGDNGDYSPGIVLNKKTNTKNRAPIALTGKTYCKVDAKCAPIELGDLLTTSSTPGHAMKAIDPLNAFGAVIGKALGRLQEGTGKMPILVALQ